MNPGRPQNQRSVRIASAYRRDSRQRIARCETALDSALRFRDFDTSDGEMEEAFRQVFGGHLRGILDGEF